MDAELLKSIWPIFSAEAREHLEQMSAGILELEREPSARAPKQLESVRRIAHTLKGSAASIGLSDVERLIHTVEEALAGDDSKRQLSRSAVDALLRAIESVSALLERVSSGGSERIDKLEELLAAISTVGGKARQGTRKIAASEELIELWPVFRSEAHELLGSLQGAAGLLAAPSSDAQGLALKEEAKLWAKNLAGLGATLDAPEVEASASALETALGAQPTADAAAFGAGLQQLAAALEQLDLAVGAAPEEVPEAPQAKSGPASWVAQIGEALPSLIVPGGAPTEAQVAAVLGRVDELIRFGAEQKATEVSRGAEKLRAELQKLARGGAEVGPAAAVAAGLLVELEEAVARVPVAEPAPRVEAPHAAPEAGKDRIIRVSATTVDGLSREMDHLVLFAARGDRRARELGAALRTTANALLSCERATSELRLRDAAIPVHLSEATDRLREAKRELQRLSRDTQRDAEQLRMISAVVREDLRHLRMMPSSVVLEPLRRGARDVAARVGKEVELETSGGDVRLDRRILEEIKDALTHLIRNAVDHGIEAPAERRARNKSPRGMIRVGVAQRGARVLIEVKDDGGGIAYDRVRSTAVRRGLLTAEAAAALKDEEAARLIFRAGFSTAEQVTAISGRGVGLDVVHDTVTRLQGTLDLSSTPGEGTCFTLNLPLTLAVKTGLLVQAGGEPCAIPSDSVERLIRVSPKQLGTIAGESVITVEGQHLPFSSLAEVLGLPHRPLPVESGEFQPAIVLAMGDQRVAVAVDAVLGQQELVVQPLGPHLAEVAHLAGASVLDNGRVVAVLHAAELIRVARGASKAREAKRRRRILVADDALTTRSAMKYLLEIAGYQVMSVADGDEALDVLANTPCELVVCDVRMPRLDGLSLCRQIKADRKLSKLPVVLVTSLDSADDRAAGLDAGADGYLVKREVERGGLVELVRQLIGAE